MVTYRTKVRLSRPDGCFRIDHRAAENAPGSLARRFQERLKTPQEPEIRTVVIVDDDLLQSEIPESGTCMIIDVNLPEMSGVELWEVLAATGHALPGHIHHMAQ
jgi:hypothetical protein